MVPRAAVGVLLAGQDVGERRVGTGASRERRRVVDGRAHERVAELESALDAWTSPAVSAGSSAVASSPSSRAAAPTTASEVGAVGGGEQQQRLRALGQLMDAGGERLLGAAVARAVRPARAARAGCRRRARPALVAPRRRRAVAEQRPRVARRRVARPAAPRRRAARTGGPARRGPRTAARRPRPAGGGRRTRARERDSRSNHAASSSTRQQRPLLGGVGQQRQRPDADQEAVGLALVRQPERAAQRARLRLGEPVDPVLERPQQLVQRRRTGAQPRTRCRSPAARGSRSPRRRVLEQRGLADARLAAQDQRTAGPAASRVEKPVRALPSRSRDRSACVGRSVTRAHRTSDRGLGTGDRPDSMRVGASVASLP